MEMVALEDYSPCKREAVERVLEELESEALEAL